jgi:inorganic pyrophosphatase
MNIWHDIDEKRIAAEEFVAVIEISKGMKKKYELDKETGMLMLDRILHTSTHYPANYGFIPRTYAEDGDPLDALVICTEDLEPMSLVKCYPIGVMHMVDGGETDDKIIAIPSSDPSWNHITDIRQLSPHTMNEIMHFFTVYKQLEKKKTTSDIKALGRQEAAKILKQAIADYKTKFAAKK